jgi:hypothetical protein
LYLFEACVASLSRPSTECTEPTSGLPRQGGAIGTFITRYKELHDTVGDTRNGLNEFEEHHAGVALGANLIDLGRH